MENDINYYPVLDVFDIVEFRDGRLAVVLPISEEPNEKELGLFSRAYTFIPRIADVSRYNDDLKCTDSSDIDIMKVLKYSKVKEISTFSHEAYMRLITDIVIRHGLYFDNFNTFNIKDRITEFLDPLIPFGWTWEREEFKEVTISDIEKKFGCKVKIVKESDNGN